MTTNDWIEKILREDAARPLADGGFTRRVMDTLPARQARHISWLRPALMMGSAALGGALAAARDRRHFTAAGLHRHRADARPHPCGAHRHGDGRRDGGVRAGARLGRLR